MSSQRSGLKWLAGATALTLVLVLGPAGCAHRVRPDVQRPFTMVMLPDTQHYSRKWPELFLAQTEWIKSNRDKESIVFVTHVGDIVNDHGKDTNQWEVANKALSVLDGVVPWGACIGNHDYDSVTRHPDAGKTFVKYFGPQRFARYSWFGGASTNGMNSYQLLAAGGIDFLILHLQLDVPDFAIAWASEVLRAHPNRAAIVTTHSYLNGVNGVNGYNTPVSRYGNSGEAVWTKLIRCHPQICLVLCGHHQLTVAYHQISTNDAGRRVPEILADYQKGRNGGDAWLRLLRFHPAEGTIEVQTYSPALKAFQTDSKNQFVVPLDLPPNVRRSKSSSASTSAHGGRLWAWTNRTDVAKAHR